MSQTPEGKVKTWLDKEIKKRYPTSWSYKPPGGRFGKAGTPDLIYCINGYFIAIEVKSSVGSLTLKQSIEQGLIKSAGGFVTTVYGKNGSIFELVDQHLLDMENRK